MTRDLVTVANENLRHAFVTLADAAQTGESREFGPLSAVSAGVSVALFNRIFVFDTPSIGELSAAVAWMADRDLPFLVTVTDPVVEDVRNHLVDLGLGVVGKQPGMAMASLDELPASDSVLDIAEVTDPDERETFSTVTASAFGWPLGIAEQVDQAALAADSVRLFLGRVDGTPAASGVLIWSEDVAGLYSIGVVEEFRRQGFGEAMSWELLRSGREAGCEVGVLQSSEMGYALSLVVHSLEKRWQQESGLIR